MHKPSVPNECGAPATVAGAIRKNEASRECFPLSLAQQRLWLLDRLEPGNAAYNLFFAVRLSGLLDSRRFQQALDEALARHRILRAEFHEERDAPVQVILPASSNFINTIDLSGVPLCSRETRALELLSEEGRKPFDLRRSPLFRALLLQLAPAEHILLLTAHSIICDQASLEQLFAELAHRYGVEAKDEPVNFEPAPEYFDLAAAEREALDGPEMQSQLVYWKQRLGSAPTSVDLPTDHLRPAIQTFRGATCKLQIAPEHYQRIQDFSVSQGTTPFTTLLAAFNILLARYSRQDDLLVGTQLTRRNSSALERTIGPLANTVVLRVDLSGDPSVADLLQLVHQTVEDAHASQDLPFERVVEQLRPERDLSRNPLFQIMFNLRNAAHLDAGQTLGLTVTQLRIESGTEKFDLSASLSSSTDGLECCFSYNRDLFDTATISRMMEHFRTLLEELPEDPQRRISEVSLLGKAEEQKILISFNQTAVDYRRDLCLHNFFEAQVERTPQAIALVCEPERLTYRELNARANRLARYLRKRGVGPEVLVGICQERTSHLLVGILGILKAGGSYVPLDPGYPKERLAAILEDAKAPILLSQQRLLDLLPSNSARVVCLDTDWPEIARESAENPANSATPENLSYVLFTSGSTGRPKGVALEHRSGATFLQWAQSVFTPDEVAGTLFSTSVCFDLSVFEMFVPLSMGGKVVMVQNALYLPRLLNPNEVTLINTVPSAIAELLRTNAVPPSVRVVNLAGEALSTGLAQQIYDNTQVQKVYNLYGPTEDTTYSTYTLVPRGGEVTIGRPLANTQAYVLDANRKPAPIRVPGELYLAGEGLARGYFGRPDLTQERFVPNPFSAKPDARMYRTGDLVRFLPDGNIQYLGRTDNQVKIRGFRIELGEIESVLSKHSAVESAVVVLREDHTGGKRLVGHIVHKSGQYASIAELQAWLKERLPEYMIPSAIIEMDALPLTPNGKIDRRRLPAPQWSAGESAPSLEARDQLEAMLIKIWQKVLGIPNIGVKDNFFDLGGHSLMAARLLSEVEKVMGRPIPLSALFRGATVESLAQLVREGGEANPDPLVMEIQSGGDGLPFFAVASPGVETLGFGLLARHMGPHQTVYKLQGHAPIVAGRPFTEEDLQFLSTEYTAAMRTIQPEGPYCLGGMCEGVQIAERMIRDLEAQGQEVAIFAIFDTWVIQHSQRLWLWRVEYLRQRLSEFKRMNLWQRWETCKRTVHTQWRRVTRKSAGKTEWYRAYWPENYRPERFRAPVVLFKRPKQPFYYVDDPEMGWGERSEGGVEIHEINFDHEELLREPHVQLLGERLAARMQRVSGVKEAELRPPEISLLSSSTV